MADGAGVQEENIVPISNKVRSNTLKRKINFKSCENRGGAFLVLPVSEGDVFSREDFTEDQKMFADAAEEFAVKRILPLSKELNVYNQDLSTQIFREMGELGFLGVDIPEEYGGLELDKTTACIVIDLLSKGQSSSIMVTASAHTGIATLPIIWYGNEQQKKKYLPKLASGEWMGCYALTEPSAGSDAMGGQASAKLSDDGKYYILNGQKIYITNGSWADVCVTFANVDGKYTGFIVDKSCEGYVIGEEEKKMGIKGSSTVTLYFENCKVPVDNVLGEVGQGGPIAFNTLYCGRYKLGVTTAAGAKNAVDSAFKFAKEREQFSRSITEFDMIKSKFARMVASCWEADNVNYMTSGSIDNAIAKLEKKSDDYYVRMQKIIEDHAIEASLCKIIGSEALAFVVDEAVQVLGGAGFIEDYDMATLYRDERINRIFEGTNEINRLLAAGTTLKKSILEELPIRDSISLTSHDWFAHAKNGNDDHKIVEYCRSACLHTLNEMINEYGQDLKNNQWVLEPFADMLCSLSIVDTGAKRLKKIEGNDNFSKHLDVFRYSLTKNYKIINDKMDTILSYACKNQQDFIKQKKFIEDYQKRLTFSHSEIDLMKSIVEAFYKHEKYYLD